MSVLNFAKSAIANSDSELLENILGKLSKEGIQELACLYKATSATISMSGSWVEKCKANLLDSSGNLILSDIQLERGFSGSLSQLYDATNLHAAAMALLGANFTSDYDEDYFTPGEMLLVGDYGYEATSSNCDADCKSGERVFNEDDIDDEEFDPFDCEVDDNGGELTIANAYIAVNSLKIKTDGYPSISIKIHEDISHLVRWFLFSVLFISSGKNVCDLGGNSEVISEFMSDYFQISV